MSKVMLVNVTHVEESRVAVLENEVLDAYEIETSNRTHIKGNIYNAVVESVHPSLEAAFVRLGPNLKGFLPIDEVNFNLLPARGEKGKLGKIGQHLHQGQKIMAQVVREPFAGKPPTVSTYFSLPGRFLVLMPGVSSAGVSRKIDDQTQRDKLKKIMNELKLPEGFGMIVRTAGTGQSKTELQRDLRYLLRLWQSIQRASADTEFPGSVYEEADLVIRTIRDHFTSDISEVWIDSQETYERAMHFMHDVMPTKTKVLRLYSSDRPLFNKFNLEEQIESIYKRRVPLPSGGEIVIDGTEALTAIDVNSGRSRRKSDVEETATQTNLEAAAEIARQLRLRDLGGLIVIDFIDMQAMRNKKRLETELRTSMKGDKAKHDVTRISKLGLVEIARQRIKGAKMGATYTTCPTCDGYGLIKNIESAALAALRKLQTRSARSDVGRIRLGLPTEVAHWMLNNKRDDLSEIERRNSLRVDVEGVPSLLRHETRMETFPREAGDAPAARTYRDSVPPLPPSEFRIASEEQPSTAVTPSTPPAAPAIAAGGEAATAKPARGDAPRRRRRRRRPETVETASASAEDAATEPVPVPVPANAAESAEPTKVLPFSSGEPADAPAGPTENEEPTVRRRRRRRRRRPRGAESTAPESGNDEAAAPVEPEVPRDVRADELMPAAVGGASRSKRSSSGRRKKKSSGGRSGSRSR